MNRIHSAALLGTNILSASLLAALSGCASVNSNVKGSFACGAPQGTCAPTTTIDDTALQTIARDGNAKAPSREPASREPGGVEPLAVVASANSPYPARTARIVFPGYTDDKGRRHDPMAVYVTLNDARGPAGSQESSPESPGARAVAGAGDGAPTVGLQDRHALAPTSTNLVTAASIADDRPDEAAQTVMVSPPDAVAGAELLTSARLRRRGQGALPVSRAPATAAPSPLPAPGSATIQSFPASSVEP